MNNTTEKTTPVPQLPYAVAFGSIMSVGFPLNAVAIWILLRHHSLKSPNVVFMLNLAISDLLLASSLPLRVYFYATGIWLLGQTGCAAVHAVFNVNIDSSSVFITFMSVDRLLAVVYPIRSRHVRTAGNATKAAVLVWIVWIIILTPLSIAFGKHLTKSFCYEHPQHGDNHTLKFGIFRLVLVPVLLVVNVVSTILVSLTLRRNVKDLPKVNSKVNVMLLLVMSLIIFTVCFLPTAVGLLIKGTQTYLQCFAAANCCLDPVLYYFSLDAFWKKKEEKNKHKLQDVA